MFKVIIFEDGHAILATDEPITADHAHVISEAFKAWRDTERGVLVINQCEVINGLKTIELAEELLDGH